MRSAYWKHPLFKTKFCPSFWPCWFCWPVKRVMNIITEGNDGNANHNNWGYVMMVVINIITNSTVVMLKVHIYSVQASFLRTWSHCIIYSMSWTHTFLFLSFYMQGWSITNAKIMYALYIFVYTVYCHVMQNLWVRFVMSL